MPCFKPFIAKINNGHGSVVSLPCPCGNCPYCRYQNRRTWSFRLSVENLYWDKSCFVTLTYDPTKYHRNSLFPSHLQNFFKRLRKRLDFKIKYFAVGEYSIVPGNNPHFHAIIFGLSKEDISIIESAWQFGFVHAGDVTEKSIKYVSGYVLKKLGKTKDRYEKYGVLPEFMRASQGLGLKFLEDFPTFATYIKYNGRTQYLGRYLMNKLKYQFAPYEDLETRRNPYTQILIEDQILRYDNLKNKWKPQFLKRYSEVYETSDGSIASREESLLTFSYKNDNIQFWRDFLVKFKNLKRLQHEKIEIQPFTPS